MIPRGSNTLLIFGALTTVFFLFFTLYSLQGTSSLVEPWLANLRPALPSTESITEHVIEKETPTTCPLPQTVMVEVEAKPKRLKILSYIDKETVDSLMDRWAFIHI